MLSCDVTRNLVTHCAQTTFTPASRSLRLPQHRVRLCRYYLDSAQEAPEVPEAEAPADEPRPAAVDAEELLREAEEAAGDAGVSLLSLAVARASAHSFISRRLNPA